MPLILSPRQSNTEMQSGMVLQCLIVALASVRCMAIDDWYYPAEELEESEALDVPNVVNASVSSRCCFLKDSQFGTTSQTCVGDTFDNWLVLEVCSLTVLPDFLSVSSSLENDGVVVMESNFARWGIVIFSSSSGVILSLRKPVGSLQNIIEPTYNLTQQYFDKLYYDTEDILAQLMLHESAPSYVNSLPYLTPAHEYGIIGTPTSYMKWVVCPDGRIKRADEWVIEESTGTSPGPGVVIFDPAKFLGIQWPENGWPQSKIGLLGRFLPVIVAGFYDSATSQGCEIIAVAPTANQSVLIRMKETPFSPPTYYSADPTVKKLEDGQLFYQNILSIFAYWNETFKPAMAIYPPYSSRRQADTLSSIVQLLLTISWGPAPNYGTGIYWTNTTARGMSLPLTELALTSVLLEAGLFERALESLGYFLDHFVMDNGTIDLGKWKASCSFADGLSDYGLLLDLFVRAVDVTTNSTFFQQYTDRALAMAKLAYGWRMAAKDKNPLPDLRHGLIYGPAEHDTCQTEDYYFSNNEWIWRGLLQFGKLLVSKQVDNEKYAELGRKYLEECVSFREDIMRAVNGSLMPIESRGGVSSSYVFIPPTCGAGKTPYVNMTESEIAEYSNFRYYPEMLSARCIDWDLEEKLMEYRTHHGCCILGLSRFDNHLDEMPTWGYAMGYLNHDMVDSYQTLLGAHMSQYMRRGTFTATEQLGIFGGTSQRDYMGDEKSALAERGVDFCTPATAMAALMTKFMLVYEDRDDNGTVVWLDRAVPGDWFEQGFAVANSPISRGRRLSFVVYPAAPTDLYSKIHVDITDATVPKSEDSPWPILKCRMLHPENLKIASTQISGGEVVSFDNESHVVIVAPSQSKIDLLLVYSPPA